MSRLKPSPAGRQTIIPHLWFDRAAVEATKFYVDTFGGDSAVTSTSVIRNTPSGDCDVVSFRLLGLPFMAISAGPYFKFNPSISFHVKCATAGEVDALWAKLSPGGSVLMELGKYPFSERYGWVQDKYGLSWQVIAADPSTIKQRIVPVLMFVGSVCGKAEAAVQFYTSVFPHGRVVMTARYGQGEEPDRAGTVKYTHFLLDGQEFGAMDSAHAHQFTFNGAISLMVHCDTQQQIDYYWEKLSAVPQAEQCGWLKDKFGVSWQVVPRVLDALMRDDDPARVARVTQAFLKMKKFDIAQLKQAAAE